MRVIQAGGSSRLRRFVNSRSICLKNCLNRQATQATDSVIQKGSRFAHLYGLPKTHKKNLAMRPILPATGTYNYKLAKWLDEKLKPLSVNDHTISDILLFADELHEMEINDHDNLVSYDLSSLLTNVPVDETIESIAERAFKDDWFNKEQSVNTTKSDMIELLRIATIISSFSLKEICTLFCVSSSLL